MRPLTDIALAILDATGCGETVAVTCAHFARKGQYKVATGVLIKSTPLSYDAAMAIVRAATDTEPATAEG